MNRFARLHPILHLEFYALSIIFVLIASNPFFSFASLICAILYKSQIVKKSFLKSIVTAAVIISFIGIFNMLFAHYGATVLFSIRNYDFTLQALIYGLNQGMVFAAVLFWFTALSYNLDGDRILYLFSFAPKLSLMFSIILGFIPRFNKKLGEIRDAQRALRGGEAPEGIKEKFSNALDNLSALISYSLESSIITADSMTARGYKAGALSVKRFEFCAQDVFLISFILVSFIYVFYSKAAGNISFIFEPFIKIKSFSPWAFILFVFVQAVPFIVEVWEGMLWKFSAARN